MSICYKITYMKTLGYRLKERRKELGLTQKEVANEIGVSSVAVTYWEKDITTPLSAHMNKLCKLLQCTDEWLLYGKGSNNEPIGVSDDIFIVKKVPLISLTQAGNWQKIIKNFKPEEFSDWKKISAELNSNSFAIRMEGDSMVNSTGGVSIPQGSIVAVDTQVKAKNGDIVVAKINEYKQTTLKKIEFDPPYTYLKPLNPSYKTIPTDKSVTVIGVVKQVIFDL